jgi:pilus assembly protein Flp/PilA
MLLKLSAAVAVRWAELRERIVEERGATAVEYALMVALIALAVLAAVALLGQATGDQFQDFNDKAGW